MKVKVKISFLVFFVLVALSQQFNANPVALEENDIQSDVVFRERISMLVNSPPIGIYSDADFITLGLPGNGSEINPYRIENLLIQDSFGYGIYISGVTAHFVIRNCVIRNSLYEGMIIQNIDFDNGNISNNVIEDCGNVGMLVMNTVGITIEDNICINNYRGIEMRYSTNGYIFNNTCEENRESGMHLRSELQTCVYENNSLINNEVFGMDFLQANGSFVYNNSLINNGLNVRENEFESYLNYVFIGNTINNKKIGYFTNDDSVSLTDTEYGQIFLFNCTNFLIENQIFEQSLFGIQVYESENCTFSNNTFDNNLAHGIDLYNSNEIVIDSNTFINNSNGLNFEDSMNLEIINNRFYSDGLVIEDADVEMLATYIVNNNTVNDKPLGFFINEHDLILSGSTLYGEILVLNSTNVEVYNQDISDTQIGFIIAFSNSCKIADSTFTDISMAILGFMCESLTISNNIIEENFDGLVLLYVDFLVLEDNIISNNLDEAIEIAYANHILLENNTCENNNGWAMILEFISYVNITDSILSHNNGGNIFSRYSDNILIQNTISDHSEWGIYLNFVTDSTIRESKVRNHNVDGIHIRNSQNMNLYANNISGSFFGVKIKNTDYCLVTYNTIRDNNVRALSFDTSSDHSIIHHNYFINNQLDDPTGRLSYGYDDGYNNTWYDVVASEGNWWSNIESYAYRIGGYGYSVDIYPLNPKDPPTPTNTPTTTTNWNFIVPALFGMSTLVVFRIRKRLRR
jgi:parallel beta-helix repeat protein